MDADTPGAPAALLPTQALVRRAVRAERDCVADWVQAMATLPGDPFEAGVGRFGGATACVCGRIPAQVWNRTFELRDADRAAIPDIVAFYRARGAAPLFDLEPSAVPPFYEGPTVLDALAAQGFYQAGFHQLLYGRPRAAVPAPAPGIAVRALDPDDAAGVAAFVRVYESVWGGGAAIRVLLGAPGFRCYLAEADGEPAALGVLHVRAGVGSMANGLTAPRFRGRGCQTALLHRRIRDAAGAGCDLLVSQCRPGSQSERNQLRAGLAIAGTKVWWIERP